MPCGRPHVRRRNFEISRTIDSNALQKGTEMLRHLARVACSTLGAEPLTPVTLASAFAGVVALTSGVANATPFTFSTGSVTNQIGSASRPGPSAGIDQETESGDDFILTTPTQITSATFTGLLPQGTSLSDISNVVAEIYRVFPKDSDVGRTSGPPTFSTSRVPTRVNSPSDVALVSRDGSASGELSYSAAVLSSSFTVQNSVDTGIRVGTGGEGSRTGQEVQFNLTLTTPFDLPADHYFFVPQVELSDPSQHFLWLSASRPIDATGTAFTPDLQAWVRNAALDPDWLRIGTDIVGAGTFNLAFSLAGTSAEVPEPATMALLGVGLLGSSLLRRRA